MVIPLTKGKLAIVDDDIFDYLNQWKWHLGKGGYAYRREYLKDGKHGFKSIYMHRLINNTPDNLFTDHINRNKLDNRKSNLRDATKSLNEHNTGLRRNNKSGYKGICWNKRDKKWQVEIMINLQKIFIGRFINLEDAVLARSKYKFYD